MNSLEELVGFLGEKNVENLQKQITEMIISHIEEDMSDWQEYIFEPERYRDFFDDCFEKAAKSIEQQVVGKMRDRMLGAYFAAWKDENNDLKGGNENGEV